MKDMKRLWTFGPLQRKKPEALMNTLDPFNSIYMMANSGARGNKQQIRQLAACAVLWPIRQVGLYRSAYQANFGKALPFLNISYQLVQEGLADTALRFADSGTLTRRLVDVSKMSLCGRRIAVRRWIMVKAIKDGSEIIEDIKERIEGRYALEDVKDPHTGEVIVHADELITEDMADHISKSRYEGSKDPFSSHLQNSTRGMCQVLW